MRNQELIQEMERVRSELLKAKTESENLLKEEKKANQNEMEKVRLELERALKKMSKSEVHGELLKVQVDNDVSVFLICISDVNYFYDSFCSYFVLTKKD